MPPFRRHAATVATPATLILFAALASLPTRAAMPVPGGAGALQPLAWDAARCGRLASEAGTVAGSPGARRLADWAVRLFRPDGGDQAAHLHARAVETSGPPALDALAPLFAGGLLIGMERDRPRGCDLAHSFREAASALALLPPGGSASERWTGIRAESGRSFADSAAVELEATRGRDGVARLRSATRDLSTAGPDMTADPVALSTVAISLPYDVARRLAAGGEPGPNDAVTIDRATIESGDAHVLATGVFFPAERRGRFHLVANDFEALKNALPVEDRTEAGAAFLVLRLAGHAEPDGALSWDIALDDAHMTINGVPLPLP